MDLDWENDEWGEVKAVRVKKIDLPNDKEVTISCSGGSIKIVKVKPFEFINLKHIFSHLIGTIHMSVRHEQHGFGK